jgi:hypothetical protein
LAGPFAVAIIAEHYANGIAAVMKQGFAASSAPLKTRFQWRQNPRRSHSCEHPWRPSPKRSADFRVNRALTPLYPDAIQRMALPH